MNKISFICMTAVVAIALTGASAQPFDQRATVTSPLQAPYEESKSVVCNTSASSCILKFPTTGALTLVQHASCTFNASVNGHALGGVGAKGTILNNFVLVGTNESGVFVTNEQVYLFYNKGTNPEVITNGTGVSSLQCTISGYHA